MILALKEKSRVYIASDSLFNDAGNLYYNQSKIWQCESEQILMAGEGDPNVIEYVRRDMPFIGDTPERNKCAVYMHNLKKIFDDNGFGSLRWAFFIGGNGKIFLIRSDGFILEVQQFETIGEGRDVANAVLNVTNSQDPEVRIRTAFAEVMKSSPRVGGNIDIQLI